MNIPQRFAIPETWFTDDQRATLAAVAIESIQKRFDDGLDVNDGPATPYSPRGPVYSPRGRVYSVGRGKKKVAMRFPNYAAMKQFIGHPPYPDLSLTGQMRAAITMVENSQERVVIGFSSEEQEKKMMGNQKHRDMWGFSPRDEEKIVQQFEVILEEALANLGFA